MTMHGKRPKPLEKLSESRVRVQNYPEAKVPSRSWNTVAVEMSLVCAYLRLGEGGTRGIVSACFADGVPEGAATHRFALLFLRLLPPYNEFRVENATGPGWVWADFLSKDGSGPGRATRASPVSERDGLGLAGTGRVGWAQLEWSAVIQASCDRTCRMHALIDFTERVIYLFLIFGLNVLNLSNMSTARSYGQTRFLPFPEESEYALFTNGARI